jgi:hypothetical protein
MLKAYSPDLALSGSVLAVDANGMLVFWLRWMYTPIELIIQTPNQRSDVNVETTRDPEFFAELNNSWIGKGSDLCLISHWSYAGGRGFRILVKGRFPSAGRRI